MSSRGRTSCSRWRWDRGGRGALPGFSREPDGKTGPSARVIAGRQAASLFAKDLGAEVESVAAAPLLGREERLEDPREVRLGDAGPVVLDEDLDPGALRLPVGLRAEVDDA